MEFRQTLATGPKRIPNCQEVVSFNSGDRESSRSATGQQRGIWRFEL